MNYQFKLVSSLEKLFFDKPEHIAECTGASMLKNELHSFQLAAWAESDKKQKVICRLGIESELAPFIRVWRIGYVPSMLPSIQIGDDEDYITKTPGLFPDPLLSVQNGELELASHQTRGFWITVEPKGHSAGIYPIILRLYDQENRLITELCYTLEIIDAELPELSIYNTGWFHGDCIAKLHGVEVLSEEYFALVEKYLAVYARFGHNMILTPIFTPPLDTEIGKERPTNQLVAVTVQNGSYSFDFTNLKRWIDLCSRHGIEYFEMAHLFTQWGAKHAPKIMATVDGVYKKLFGWETDALSEEYCRFLDAFMPELLQFLKQEGILERCFFHTSDEPDEKDELPYRAAKEILLSYVEERQLIDALGNYSFYEKGIVKTPIVCNDHIRMFLDHGVENLWTYYCMAQRRHVSNRFMAMPSYRNRILGYQLYKNRIKGFLQWGFNFWFSAGSQKVINPYIDTSADGAFPSGDAFVVYPVDERGEPVCSLRLYVFHEALQDMRALELLESLTDRESVMDMLTEIEGFENYPRNSEYILALREAVNQRIKARQ